MVVAFFGDGGHLLGGTDTMGRKREKSKMGKGQQCFGQEITLTAVTETFMVVPWDRKV